MATIEMNMLSVITCGSISVRVFCPGMDKLALEDRSHATRYPVLWLLHDDGGAALDFLDTPAERIAKQYGIFLIAPDQHHAMGTDMKFGPRYEYFFCKELQEICRNCLPISDDPAKNWVAGVGTGAYGAMKMALKHPDVFSGAAALHGRVDMEAMIQKALAGADTGTPQTKASLEAVFGDLTAAKTIFSPFRSLREAGSSLPGSRAPAWKQKIPVWPPRWTHKPWFWTGGRILIRSRSACAAPRSG